MKTRKHILPIFAGLALTAASAQAAPIAAGDVIKLDVSDNGDGAGIKTADWNTIVAFPSSIASVATPSAVEYVTSSGISVSSSRSHFQ